MGAYRLVLVRLCCATLVGGGALASLPGVAAASSVSAIGSTTVLAAAPGEVNDLTVTVAAGHMVITDPTNLIGTGSGCTLTDGTTVGAADHTVWCGLNFYLQVDLGDMNDTLTIGKGGLFDVAVYGGPGADVITYTGDRGTNVFDGGPDNDRITGGSGVDHLFGGNGSDTLIGGGGRDQANYGTSPAGVTVNLTSGRATDGFGTTDSLQSIEDISGTPYNDRLTGTAAVNRIDAGRGNDVVAGLGGADSLWGYQGADLVSYATAPGRVWVSLLTGNANDGFGSRDVLHNFENVTGSRSADILHGSYNRNVLTGGGGNDSLFGSHGGDTLLGGHGNDRLAGGLGTDRCPDPFGTNTRTSCESR